MSPDPAAPARLFLLDAHSHLYRAYHAIPPLTSRSGFPTNALHGFLTILNRIVKAHTPRYLAVLFDAPGPGFRADWYPQYKANRPPMPDDLRVQVEKLKQILDAMGVPRFEAPGFEADDLIATLCARAAAEGLETWIVSADKDLMQLVGPRVRMLRYHRDQEEIVDEEGVKRRLGVAPGRVLDYLALVGDSSDNIPGARGIGPKTAIQLLERFGSVENLLARAPEIEKPRLRQILQDFAEQIRLSRRLATLRADAPAAWDLERMAWRPALSPALRELYRELDFHSLLNEASAWPAAPAAPAPAMTGAPAAPSPASPPEAAATARAAPGFAAEEDLFPETLAPAEPPRPRLADSPNDYGSLRTPEALRQFVEAARAAGRMAVDTETTGLDPFTCSLVGISLSHSPGAARYIPLGHNPASAGGAQLSLDVVREILGPALEDPRLEKVFHHYAFDYKFLKFAGLKVGGVVLDTMLASYLLRPEGARHGLKALARERLGVEPAEIRDLFGGALPSGDFMTFDLVAIEDAEPYACQDADLTLRLAALFEPELAQAGLGALLREIEAPLAPVLAEMELTGVRIDLPHFARLEKETRDRLRELERDAHAAAGCVFNLASPKQIAQVLFERLRLPTRRKGKTGFSTDVSVLESLYAETRHPLLPILLEHRAAEKLLNTYIAALPRLVHPVTGMIHTSFNQTSVATGRLSSSEPNLQNIPVRTPQGRQIRQGFVPSAPGRVLLAADYSQIELRLLAHVSGDPALVEAFRHGADIHRATAARIFRCAPGEVTDEMRARAKTVNFGVIYGISPHGLAAQLGISRGEARQFIEEYFAAYPGVRSWIERTLTEARRMGVVTTLRGRRRAITGLNSPNPNQRAFAERIAINTPIQGSAADMIKIAMIALDRRLRRENFQARMILQVHDELIFDVPESETGRLSQAVREEMEGAMPLSIPVVVDIKTGANWSEC